MFLHLFLTSCYNIANTQLRRSMSWTALFLLFLNHELIFFKSNLDAILMMKKDSFFSLNMFPCINEYSLWFKYFFCHIWIRYIITMIPMSLYFFGIWLPPNYWLKNYSSYSISKSPFDTLFNWLNHSMNFLSYPLSLLFNPQKHFPSHLCLPDLNYAFEFELSYLFLLPFKDFPYHPDHLSPAAYLLKAHFFPSLWLSPNGSVQFLCT